MKKYILCIGLLLQFHVNAQLECDPLAPASMVGATQLGDGSPGSVTTNMIQDALDLGGAIQFNVGSSPVQIDLTETLLVTKGSSIDGGGLVTLSGQNALPIIRIENPDNIGFSFNIQNISLENGFTATESGAAIYKPVSGDHLLIDLNVYNVNFENNHAIQLSQDFGGGAIYAFGLNDINISHSTFYNNSGSNGGAIYSFISNDLTITDSSIDSNMATGTGGNPGNGGNGGAIGVDGLDRIVNVCRTQITNNSANTLAGGIYAVMYDSTSETNLTDVLVKNNVNLHTSNGSGGAYFQDGSINIKRSSFIGNQARSSAGLNLIGQMEAEITNSTFYGNIASESLGGAMNVQDSVVLTIRHSTIVGNQALFAAGISVPSPNQITMYNSILANNIGDNEHNQWNIRNEVSGSDNLQYPQNRPNSQAETPATPDVMWAEPLLSLPAMNGGFTPTMATNGLSPGVNQASVAQSTAQDQRLLDRYLSPDLGAYELQADLIFADGFN